MQISLSTLSITAVILSISVGGAHEIVDSQNMVEDNFRKALLIGKAKTDEEYLQVPSTLYSRGVLLSDNEWYAFKGLSQSGPHFLATPTLLHVYSKLAHRISHIKIALARLSLWSATVSNSSALLYHLLSVEQ